MEQWKNISAGPRQLKDLQRAMSRLNSEGQTHNKITGVIGGESHTSTYWTMCPVRPEVTALDLAIREKYGYQITSKNVRAITAEYADVLAQARLSRPSEDNRITQEELDQRNAIVAARNAEEKAKQDAADKVMAGVLAKAPSGAKALIVAEYHVDASDPMTDYFASHTARTVAIGFRFSAREDFRALRAAAAGFAEIGAAAADLTEHRDNYSMGAGNYLSDHGWAGSGTGWVIKSRDLPCGGYVTLTEDAIPDTVHAPQSDAPAVSASAGGVTVTPSSIGRAGVVEVRFASKPAEEVRAALKSRGFRWARSNGCWYGRDTEFAESLVSAS